MDFMLTDDQVALQDLARDFAQHELAPHAALWDAEKIFPQDVLRKAASLGFAGIYIDEKYGGSGLGRVEAALLFEALSEGCVSSAAYLSIHNMVSGIINKYGTEAQRQNWLPRLTSLELFSSYCLTEPNSGSDAASLKTKATQDGEHYILNGSKAFISGGGVSDLYVAMVRTSEDGPKGITCLLIEKNTPGLSFGKQEEKMGWNSQPTSMVFFENCKVPLSNRLGEVGQGFKIAMEALDGGRLNIGACSLGGAQAALKTTQHYMREREQFGKPLNQFQALQFRMADMATDFTAAQLMIYRAAHAFDTNHKDKTMLCAMAKRFATDAGFNIVNQALQLHGGYGYLREYPLERLVRDLRVHQILEGTNEIMRVIIAKKLEETA